jgi:putative two-component system response regulator
VSFAPPFGSKPVETTPLPLIVACLSRVEHLRDFGTNCHARRVAFMVEQVGLNLGLEAERCREIGFASMLHDIGKMAVPLDLLNKSAALSAEEVAVIKTHCRRGHEILQGHSDKLILLASEISLRHHERYDGTGYPDGLAGKAIPQSARIIAVCDVYDALRQDRPYRRGLTHAEAMATIVKGDGRTRPEQFDPVVLGVFRELETKTHQIFESYDALADEASLMGSNGKCLG